MLPFVQRLILVTCVEESSTNSFSLSLLILLKLGAGTTTSGAGTNMDWTTDNIWTKVSEALGISTTWGFVILIGKAISLLAMGKFDLLISATGAGGISEVSLKLSSPSIWNEEGHTVRED